MKKNLIYIILVATLALALVGIHPSEAQVSTGSITTLFTSDNSADGNMFDVTALETLTITSFDVNIFGTNCALDVYYKQGTYVGFEQTPGAWTLLGSVTVTSLGTNVPTPVAVGGLTIPAGDTYALYLGVLDPCDMNYTNGTNTIANTEIQLDLGAGLDNPFGTVFAGRVWNGTVYYEYGSAVVPVAGLNIPQLGMVKIDTTSPTAAYSSPAGEPVRFGGGDLWLPNDADNNGFDTYVVTETATVDGRWWVALFIGNETWVWVPYDAVQPLNYFSFE